MDAGVSSNTAYMTESWLASHQPSFNRFGICYNILEMWVIYRQNIIWKFDRHQLVQQSCPSWLTDNANFPASIGWTGLSNSSSEKKCSLWWLQQRSLVLLWSKAEQGRDVYRWPRDLSSVMVDRAVFPKSESHVKRLSVMVTWQNAKSVIVCSVYLNFSVERHPCDLGIAATVSGNDTQCRPRLYDNLIPSSLNKTMNWCHFWDLTISKLLLAG